MTMSREEIPALLQLLDDPNDEVNRTVTSRLMEQGPTILPDLEAAWEGSSDKAIKAFLNDPHCTDIDAGVRLLNELIDAQAAYLPRFS